ncbi:MAG: PDZ domain-containing protein, partial [Thermoguttaceae bacterium]
KAFDPEQPNVAVGVVSALDRVWGKVVQTDAAVSPNNYGGPLVDLEGNVLGLLVPMSPMSDEEVAGVEWYDSGIGFAVTADRLTESVRRLKAGVDLHTGLAGMVFEKSVAMSGPPIVSALHPNGPAEKAGLRKGDRVVRVGSEDVARWADFRYALAARYAGDSVDLLVRRGEETIRSRVDLVAELEPYHRPSLGILPRREAEPGAGVTVRGAVPESPAAGAGVVAGDRIVSLEGENVTDSDQLRSRLARRRPGEKVAIELVRGEERKKLEVTLASAPATLPDQLPARTLDPEAEAGRTISLSLPQWKNAVRAYLPKAYSPQVGHGLLVWLRSPSQRESGLEAWEKHADSRGVIVVLVEPSAADRWLPDEVELVGDVLRLCQGRFTVDPKRTVVGGHMGGGSLAYRVAAADRDHLGGCILFDAAVAGPALVDEPENRFSLLIGHREEGRLAEGLDQAADLLRKGGLPVVVVTRGVAADRLEDRDLSAAVRWIDLLDQI